MKKRERLEAGVVIRYMDIEATVIADEGGATLLVNAEETTQRWEWCMDGIECEVVR